MLLVERQEETVLVAHRFAHDAQQTLCERVDVEHRADLRRESLQDRELPPVRVGRRGELLEHAARTGNVLHVRLFDRADATEVRLAVLAITIDDTKERVDNVGMELRAAAARQLRACELDALRLLVRAAAHDDFEGIRGSDDVRLDRDRVAGELLGVAGAIEALVVRGDDRHEVAQGLDGREDGAADRRVRAHEHPLVGGERPGLIQDRVGHADLADVMEQRAELHAPQLVTGHPHLVRDRSRQRSDPRGVAARVRIPRVDRCRERLHRCEVQLAHL